MSSLTVSHFGSQGIRFEQRGERLWGCLTDMAKASGKRVHDWSRLDSTKEFLAILNNSITGIPVMTQLQDFEAVISVNKGGEIKDSGAWGIEEVVLKFAAWCSPEFEIWVYQQIKTLINTGRVELITPELVLPPTAYERAQVVNNLSSALNSFDIDIQNPRFKQGFQDLVLDIMGVGEKVLTSAEELGTVQQMWCGVAERAEQLGYRPTLITRHRSQLGKWVKSQGLEPRTEKRLCNGTQREVNLYLVSERFDEVIRKFMDSKLLG